MSDSIVSLKDGRNLGVLRFGDPQGPTVFLFHGFPGSRNQFLTLKDNPQFSQFDLICLDRPGIGLSDDKAEREILDWPSDVAEVASQLEVERFSVLGVSGGCPYALACAYKLGSELKGVGVIAGLGPMAQKKFLREMPIFARMGFLLGQRAPAVLPPSLHGLMRIHELKPKEFFQVMSLSFCEQDRAKLSDPLFVSSLSQSFQDAFEKGSSALSRDLELMSRDWGFDLRAIKREVQFWHGTEDRVVPYPIGEFLQQQLPRASLRRLDGAGHYSAPIDRAYEALSAII